jgi:hypothetical protein
VCDLKDLCLILSVCDITLRRTGILFGVSVIFPRRFAVFAQNRLVLAARTRVFTSGMHDLTIRRNP